MAEFKIPTQEELKKMSNEERKKLLLSAETELAKLIPLLKTGKIKQSHHKTALRKLIARIKTLNSASQHA